MEPLIGTLIFAFLTYGLGFTYLSIRGLEKQKEPSGNGKTV